MTNFYKPIPTKLLSWINCCCDCGALVPDSKIKLHVEWHSSINQRSIT